MHFNQIHPTVGNSSVKKKVGGVILTEMDESTCLPTLSPRTAHQTPPTTVTDTRS
jgi:hypothetical protein